MSRDGGPAFPGETTGRAVAFGMPATRIQYGGMTLRDWFAGQALAGSTAADTAQAYGVQDHARYAYECADAMLAVREAE